MTLIEFKSLPHDDRAMAAREGVYLGGRKTQSFYMMLYDVDGFYVEMLVHRQSHSIYKYRAFQSTTFIDAYLTQIDISNALEFINGG